VNDPVLEVKDLKVSFGGVTAVDAVSFAVEQGARVGVIGPNGAGKTTLFNLISGWVRPQEGHVRLQGRDVTRSSPDALVRQGLTRTFQRTQMCHSLSVQENVELALLARSGRSARPWRPVRRRHDIVDGARRLLTSLGLGGVGPAPCAMLSYGVLRQAEVAVALATEPAVLLLDEPTSGLSPAETSEMLTFLARLPEETTLLIIEHDMDILFGLAQRVLVMEQGRLLIDGTPDEVRSDDRVREAYMGTSAGSEHL